MQKLDINISDRAGKQVDIVVAIIENGFHDAILTTLDNLPRIEYGNRSVKELPKRGLDSVVKDFDQVDRSEIVEGIPTMTVSSGKTLNIENDINDETLGNITDEAADLDLDRQTSHPHTDEKIEFG